MFSARSEWHHGHPYKRMPSESSETTSRRWNVPVQRMHSATGWSRQYMSRRLSSSALRTRGRRQSRWPRIPERKTIVSSGAITREHCGQVAICGSAIEAPRRRRGESADATGAGRLLASTRMLSWPATGRIAPNDPSGPPPPPQEERALVSHGGRKPHEHVPSVSSGAHRSGSRPPLPLAMLLSEVRRRAKEVREAAQHRGKERQQRRNRSDVVLRGA